MIPFANISKQNAGLRPEIDAVLDQVLSSGHFVLGEHVERFEESFAAYCGAASGVAVNSGTSALHIALLAAGVGPGDEVITPAFTFRATAAAIDYAGARPVLADIDPRTFTIDPSRIEGAITPKTRAILPVHLYGHPAAMDEIIEIARRYDLPVIEDAAQAHGAEYRGRRTGSQADASCFSFYPGKNLGACGEGGIMLTNRDDWASKARRLRDWGMDDRGQQVMKAFNYRMESIQGAVLGVKLPHLDGWNTKRRANAARYDEVLAGTALHAGGAMQWAKHVYHIYAIRCSNRDAIQRQLRDAGVETRVHYPWPIHLLEAWRGLGYRTGDFPAAERAAKEVLSIPVHPELEPVDADQVAGALAGAATAEATILESARSAF